MPDRLIEMLTHGEKVGLRSLNPRPLAIGIALVAARLSTIFPQPHDIPLDVIVTEGGVSTERTARP